MFNSRRKQFETLTWPLSGDLFRFAYWRLGNRQDAEDVVQETFLKAYRSFHTFERGTNARAWMTRIMINVIKDTFKRRSQQPEVLALDDHIDEIEFAQSSSAALQNPETQLTQNEVDPQLLEALKRLPSALLHPLLLREFEDMTYNDIAAVLDVPVGTVMSRLFRARQLVRRLLSGRSGSPDDAATEVANDDLH
ncbi:MAG TPA: sigma-70 family RNA polymerase sigma factor [Candidatus Obscuribacterales bacterium]